MPTREQCDYRSFPRLTPSDPFVLSQPKVVSGGIGSRPPFARIIVEGPSRQSGRSALPHLSSTPALWAAAPLPPPLAVRIVGA